MTHLKGAHHQRKAVSSCRCKANNWWLQRAPQKWKILHPATSPNPAIPPKKRLIPLSRQNKLVISHPASSSNPAIPPKNNPNPAIPPRKRADPAIPPTPSSPPHAASFGRSELRFVKCEGLSREKWQKTSILRGCVKMIRPRFLLKQILFVSKLYSKIRQ